MKVLMTADTVGGVWTYALELVDALATLGAETTVAAMGPLRPGQRAEIAGSRAARVEVRDYALEWMPDPWDDVAHAGEWLLRLADEVAPDVVHLNGYAHAALPWPAPVVVAGHSDVLSWHRAVRGEPAGPEWNEYREAVSAGLASADLLVAPTGAMLDELILLYEPPCPRLVIPNATSRSFVPGPKAELVLTAGRLWDEAKNVEALVRVAPRLPWTVAVAGEGDVGEGVRALGPLCRPAMDAALAAAAIFAEPARYEPFGLAALEAARAGCALVLGDVPSLREVWGDDALFVAPDDDAALERALLALIEDGRFRADFAARARRRSRRYAPRRMAAAYLAAYGLALREPQEAA